MQKIFGAILLLAICWSCSDNGDSIFQQNRVPPVTDQVTESEDQEENQPATYGPITYLALGDSYTIGQGVDESMRWPNQLKYKLKANNVEVSQVDIIARTGWTTSNLLEAIAEKNPAKYDLVSLLIGVNNQFQGKPFSKFENEFDELLIICQTLAGGSKGVFVVSIPDYGVTPFGSAYGNAEKIAREIDQYNYYIQMKCKEKGIQYIDITYLSRVLADSEEALVADQLHPSAFQYSKWIEVINLAVLDLLEVNNE